MSAFEVDVDGRVLGDAEALRAVTSWMMRHYQEDVRGRSGPRTGVLMDFIYACGESVRIREATGVPSTELIRRAPEKVEVSIDEAAPRFGYSPEYLRRLARAGRVGSRRVGRVWLIDITNFLEETA
ncbi:hypothetical protein [Frondihabitans cladoniiphilus]|uniref:Helix-turn-helix domain-containing protein n=1 Tax=Frondihabitans cladoniiphilus TaxID=715785 RepID=A0ABP8WBX5_9MICO